MAQTTELDSLVWQIQEQAAFSFLKKSLLLIFGVLGALKIIQMIHASRELVKSSLMNSIALCIFSRRSFIYMRRLV